MDNDIKDFMEAGVNHVFKKPINKNKIKKLLDFVNSLGMKTIGPNPIIETEDFFTEK